MTSDVLGLEASHLADARESHLGWRLRQVRLLARLNEKELGRAVGLTHQQIHKYERAMSRIGASRLWGFSLALRCPVSRFFEELAEDTEVVSEYLGPHARGSGSVSTRQEDGSRNREMMEPARAYNVIKQGPARSTFLEFVRTQSEEGDPGA